MEHDVIIIGAGIAGLTAGRTLKSHNISYAILEAGTHIGGRAVTHITPSGTAIDLGAHWLHGEGNPLRSLLKQYGLASVEDKADPVLIHRRGEVKEVNLRAWLDEAIARKRKDAILRGEAPDCALPDLAADPAARRRLLAFARLWDGLSPPHQPSAREFLTDKSRPGGLQVVGGIGKLVDGLAEDVGREHIHTGKVVRHVKSKGDSAIAYLATGEEWVAKKILFTGSLGVIKSGMVRFEPTLRRSFRNQLARIAMGDMNRITVELRQSFLDARRIPENLSIELLSGYPHFCHVRAAGTPTISLFVAGPRARQVETMKEEQALAYFCRALTNVRLLRGFASYIVGDPVISRWSSNPFIRGSYSSCLPGGTRTGPCVEGCVYFCGDTFDEQYPGSMAGAARSGKVAAEHAIESLGKICDIAPAHEYA